MLGGLDRPTEGKVFVDGKDIFSLKDEELTIFRRRKIGFVFQQMNMMENLNILDNILLPAIQANKERKRLGKGKTALSGEAERRMRKLSISDLGQRKITEVSGGQLQRACICRSMMNHPEILFADEPTGALNQSATEEVMEALASLNREGATILMVTHDSRLASRCERILYLVDGRLQGELTLGGGTNTPPKQREERVNRWLSGMGW